MMSTCGYFQEFYGFQNSLIFKPIKWPHICLCMYIYNLRDKNSGIQKANYTLSFIIKEILISLLDKSAVF